MLTYGVEVWTRDLSRGLYSDAVAATEKSAQKLEKQIKHLSKIRQSDQINLFANVLQVRRPVRNVPSPLYFRKQHVGTEFERLRSIGLPYEKRSFMKNDHL